MPLPKHDYPEIPLLASLALDREWLARPLRPACAGAKCDFVFDYDGRGKVPEGAQTAAETYCAVCPLADACGTWADENRMPGVWAGSFRHPQERGAYTKVDLLVSYPVKATA